MDKIKEKNNSIQKQSQKATVTLSIFQGNRQGKKKTDK